MELIIYIVIGLAIIGFFGDFFSVDTQDESINDLSRFILDENIFYLNLIWLILDLFLDQKKF